MYSNEDLNSAINDGIFTQDNVDKFRESVSLKRKSPSVDEENFRLISGFNDIFVVIASMLTLLSASWVTYKISPILSAIVVSLISWGLAEFFVRKRKMSFPAIILLSAFVGNSFYGFNLMFKDVLNSGNQESLMLSSILTGIMTYLHWKRFKVPITLAFGMSVLIVFFISTFLSIFRDMEGFIPYLTLSLGFVTFKIAMYWDMKDTKRVSNNSDIAFWLHLLSAPLIVHSIFTILGVFNSSENGIGTILAIILLYITLSSISLIIDRRAFMVSSLAYVLYALTKLFNTYGVESGSFAMAGMMIGFALLLLSGYWSKVRKILISFLPKWVRIRVPLV